MTKFCPKCGMPNEDNAHYCVRCGYNFDNLDVNLPSKNQNLGEEINREQTNSIPRESLFSKINYLRSGFFWLFIGTILMIIPLANFIAPIFLFVGYIILIIGFNKISKSSLKNVGQYKSTSKFLLTFVIFEILLSILLIIFFITVLNVILSSNIETFTQMPAIFSGSFTVLIYILSIISFILYIISFLKIIESLKLLSKELLVQRLRKAGNYLFYSLILFVISIIILILLIFITGMVTSIEISTGNSPLYILSLLLFLIIPSVLIIISYILQIIGYYFAYAGIDEFESQYSFV